MSTYTSTGDDVLATRAASEGGVIVGRGAVSNRPRLIAPDVLGSPRATIELRRAEAQQLIPGSG